MNLPLSRRNLIRSAGIVVGGGVLAAASLGFKSARAQSAKVAPSAAQYQTSPKGAAQCAGCTSFIAPGSCNLVSGAISPSGWCILFAAKS